MTDNDVSHCCGTPENPKTGTCWCGITDFQSEPAPSWQQLFPEGRVIYCEEDGDSAIYAFVEAVKEEFGFDPSADPLWDWQALSGPRFRCPHEHLDAIYGSGRWRMGS